MGQTQPFLPFTPNTVLIQRVDVPKQHVHKHWPPAPSVWIDVCYCIIWQCVSSSCAHNCSVYSCTHFSGISKMLQRGTWPILCTFKFNICRVIWFRFFLNYVKIMRFCVCVCVCVNMKYNTFSGKLLERVILTVWIQKNGPRNVYFFLLLLF